MIRWAALLLIPFSLGAQAQDFQFIEPFGRTVSPSLEGTQEDEDMLRSRAEGAAPVIKVFAAAIYADADDATVAAAVAGVRRNSDQVDFLFGRIDPDAASSDIDRWRVRYKHNWAPKGQRKTDLTLYASLQDTRDVAQRTEAGLAAEHPFATAWFAAANLGAVHVNPESGDAEDDFVASIGVRRELGPWSLAAEYGLKNKIDDDVVTLTVSFAERLIVSVDDDETVLLTAKYVF